MKVASMQSEMNTPHEVSEFPNGEESVPPAARVAVQRVVSNLYSLWCLCEKGACRRAHRCKGDPDECLETLTPLLSDAVIDGGRCMLKGNLENLSFEDLHTRHPDAISAIAHWIRCIDRGSAQWAAPSRAKKADDWRRQTARAKNRPGE